MVGTQRVDPETGATFVAFVNESGSIVATSGPAVGAFPDLTGRATAADSATSNGLIDEGPIEQKPPRPTMEEYDFD